MNRSSTPNPLQSPEAAALLKSEKIRWHIVGDGACEEACRRLADERQLGEQVRFYGRRPLEEMPEFIFPVRSRFSQFEPSAECTHPHTVFAIAINSKNVIIRQ